MITAELNLDQELGFFMENVKLPGRTIFAKVWGSHSHNTALPESDLDFLAVYIVPTWDLLGLDSYPETVDQNMENYTGPDFQAHEISKFCRLLMKGNPGIIEMLFTEKFCTQKYAPGSWGTLRSFRRDFLTQVTVDQYLGYAEGQLKRLQKGAKLGTTGGTYNTKWAYHMLRLLGDAKKIVQGKPPSVLKDGDELDMLMKVRRGEYTESDINTMARWRMAQIEDEKPWGIPAEMPKAKLNDWLIEMRQEECLGYQAYNK